jgi:CDP-6-deoxy-D-xylo-4-hexulose-3-dehydrase
MKDEISNFIEKLGNDHQILNFLHNMKKQEFDRTKDSVYYSGPYWDNAEIIALFEAVLSGKWFTCGAKVDKFERNFSKRFGHKSSVMVNSGSSANLVMIAALKKYFSWNDNAEVIVSTVGFPTTIAPLIQNNLKPVFTDINMQDLNFNLQEVESKITKKTKAIFISPVLGNPPDMDKLVELSKIYEINLLLDNCDSLGSKWDNKELSEFVVSSTCSFYPAHHITTGEGGMVSSNQEEIIELARSFAWWGRDCYCVGSANLLTNGTCKRRFDKWLQDVDIVIDHKYLFSNIGYNLKPLDLQGALGIEQLKKFDQIHEKRRSIKKIISLFIANNVANVRVIDENKKAETSWFGVPIVCDSPGLKKHLVKHLEENRIQTRNYFAGNILLHPAYRDMDEASNYPNANKVLETVFFIGCSPTYSNKMLEHIESVFKKFEY